MAVDTKHSAYTAFEPQWRRCRDAIAGQDAVHAGRDLYLPKLSEQTEKEYAAYIKRAPFYGATGRTHDGLVGMVFRKAPRLTAPQALIDMTEDITLSGVALDGLAREVMGDVLAPGRIGLLVEFPQIAAQPISLAAASAMNLRPYVSAYKAESIINWSEARINNAMQPTLVVLSEEYEDRKDEFTAECKPQIRALMLIEGKYVQRIYRKGTQASEWILVDEVTPQMNGKPLTRIPFFPFGPEATRLDCQRSPLLDLVDLNLSHYRSSADLEHGAHFTGLPMLMLAGVQLAEGEKVYAGSAKAITSMDPQSKGFWIEFSGQGLGALEKRCEVKEQQMAALGARMLAPEKAGVEAQGTMAMRHNGEDSVLAGMADLVSDGLTEVLTFMAEWAGIAGEIEYELNKDYLPAGMSAQDLAALIAAWQSGGISYETLFANLQKGEIVSAETTAEEEQSKLEVQGPALGTITGTSQQAA